MTEYAIVLSLVAVVVIAAVAALGGRITAVLDLVTSKF
jgi:Flp pilus assembly pilin Flp